MLDFTVYQLQQIAEKEYVHIPGVLVESAKKSSHRHRQEDILAVQVIIEGSQEFMDIDLQTLVDKASEIFFHSQGSVTRAIQAAIEEINKDIYNLNADLAIQGEQVIGSINMMALHKGLLFIGQVGDAFIYHIGDDVFEIIGENVSAQEKLGVSRRIPIQFRQCTLNPGDLLLMSPRTHGSWKSYYLSNSHNIPVDQLKRRLCNQMIQDFSVVVLETQQGTGNISRGEWDQNIEGDLAHTDEQLSKENGFEKIDQELENSEKFSINKTKINPLDEQVPESINEEISTGDDRVQLSEGVTESIDFSSEGKTINQRNPIAENKKFLQKIARFWMQGKTLRAKIKLYVARLQRKIFPKKIFIPETNYRWQKIVVLVFPALIIFSAINIYSNHGKVEQYNLYMNSAKEKSILAEQAETNTEKKDLWTDVLELSIKAEEYRVTNESRQLLTRAQSVVDRMDLTTRLNFRPAMTQPFPDDTTITKIKDSSSGIYLLNSFSGSIFRVFTNSKGFFEIDEEFQCKPGNYGLVEMHAIVDFAVLPANNMGYKILAIDETGNLLYCQPGKSPDSRTLTIPEGGWGKIETLIYSDERLLVIDPMKNDILTYESSNNTDNDLSGIVFVEAPSSFFAEDIPDMGGAIDATINQNDLYILHEDGHMTLCQRSYEETRSPECEDPVPFSDNRISSENKKPWIFMGTKFIAITQSTLPNPSLLLLDEISGTIFQFSMQLNLDNTLKPHVNPDFPLPSPPPTGFGILLDQEIILAFGNQLFTAPLQ